MANLLQETLENMEKWGYTPSKIFYIGTTDWYVVHPTLEQLTVLDVEYDDSFGCHEVDENLVIVFEDSSWMERVEYDGSEWWAHKKYPGTPQGKRVSVIPDSIIVENTLPSVYKVSPDITNYDLSKE